ncbi:MAG TPA: MerR family transcriptional regulator [Actinocatenispora sp.]
MTHSDDGLSAGDVARRIGVAVTTVRTWDRRYGLGPAVREEGRHRRYQPGDVARLERMRQLVSDGVAPAEAARIAGSGRPAPRRVARAEPAASPDARVRGLRRAAYAMDSTQMRRILADAVRRDVVGAWTDLMCPTLRDIGRRHAATGRYVEVEHLLSHEISYALAAVPAPRGRARILLACGPDEQHSLALEALAAALADRGRPARMLGGRVPVDSLAAAITRTGPQAVVLWSHHARPGDVAQLNVARAARPRPPLVAVAGPGWIGRSVPAGAIAFADLPTALDAVDRATRRG